MLLILGLLLFVLLVIIHEFGHYLAAKKSGVDVEEFGVGFPPRMFGKKFKGDGTLYSVNWLPLGGFVKLKGEHDQDKGKGTYGSAPFIKKTGILLAGVGMNLLAAAVLLTILSFVGMPKLTEDQFAVASDTKVTDQSVIASFVAEGSPAEAGGVKVEDELVKVGNYYISSSEDVVEAAEAQAGQTIGVEVIRDEQPQTLTVTLNPTRTDTEGYFGVGPAEITFERSTWSAPIRGIVLTLQFFWLTLSGLLSTIGQLFGGQPSVAAESVTGPVGIVVLLNQTAEAGAVYLLFFVALISIALAVMNVLPIPALDGGRLFVSGLFRVLKKPLSPRLEERIHATGMVALLALVALITIVDVGRFF